MTRVGLIHERYCKDYPLDKSHELIKILNFLNKKFPRYTFESCRAFHSDSLIRKKYIKKTPDLKHLNRDDIIIYTKEDILYGSEIEFELFNIENTIELLSYFFLKKEGE